MPAYRIFLASPKATEAEVVDRDAEFVLAKFMDASPVADLQFTVVKSADDFRENFSRCGGWTEWAQDVGAGVDYMFRTPRFNAIVVTTEHVGRATADIVRSALGARRMVTLLQPDRSFCSITGVQTVDEENWQSGWRMVTE